MKPKKDDQIATCQEAANGRSEFKPQLTKHGSEITESEDKRAVHEQSMVPKKESIEGDRV